MKWTPEQLDAHNQRRRARLERIAPHFRFYEWIDGAWRPCDAHAWAWARFCLRVRIHLAELESGGVADDRVCMRVSVYSMFMPHQKGAAA
jgi:hypothetical protein